MAFVVSTIRAVNPFVRTPGVPQPGGIPPLLSGQIWPRG